MDLKFQQKLKENLIKIKKQTLIKINKIQYKLKMMMYWIQIKLAYIRMICQLRIKLTALVNN